jgi:hydroxylaminobenzene mutase
MILILLGLVVGLAIPVFTNPRMGLSTHLVGVLAGMLLVVMSLAWRHIELSKRFVKLALGLLLYSAYAIWTSTLLGSIWGTSKATPIAGSGFSGAPWQEVLVSLGLATGSLAALVAFSMIVWQLCRMRR